jgi:hypothetical protein
MTLKKGTFVALAGLALVLGTCSALLWAMYAALYVPLCPHFGWNQPLPECSRPVIALYASLGLAALGGATLLGMASRGVIQAARRRASGLKA